MDTAGVELQNQVAQLNKERGVEQRANQMLTQNLRKEIAVRDTHIQHQQREIQARDEERKKFERNARTIIQSIYDRFNHGKTLSSHKINILKNLVTTLDHNH